MLAPIFACLSLLHAGEAPEPVAMVLAVQGPVKLRRMDLLRPGDELTLPPAASVQILVLRDGHKETLKPGLTVRITDSGGAPAEAVKREETVLPKAQLEGLRSLAASARAGVTRVRDIGTPPVPLAPINDTIVLSDRPTFRWAKSENAAEYKVSIYPDNMLTGQSALWSKLVRKPEMLFPKEQAAFTRGARYTWYVTDEKKNVIVGGGLTVATAEHARDFEPLQKLAGSKAVSDKLLAAMLFEEGHIYDESGRLFESLAKEMPAEPWILLACARHLGRIGRTEEAASMEKKALELSRQVP